VDRTALPLFDLSPSPSGVPENDEMLIEFLKQVQQAQDADAEKPLVVHCSGGVGRTGTFIALYVIKQLIDKNVSPASRLPLISALLDCPLPFPFRCSAPATSTSRTWSSPFERRESAWSRQR
jgi:hypothetical protein